MTKHDLTEDQKKVMFTLMCNNFPYSIDHEAQFVTMLNEMGQFHEMAKGEIYAQMADEVLKKYKEFRELETTNIQKTV